MSKTTINVQGFPSSPIIYAYTIPNYEIREGWIKIGQTRRDAKKRIAQQTHTAGVRTKLEWQDYAIYKDGSGQTFTDKQFHHWLVGKMGVKRLKEKGVGNEWFNLDADTSKNYFDQFANREIPVNEKHSTYVLRKEQQEAVNRTRAWFDAGEEDDEHRGFLWNAKPRFGKTLTSYALIEQLKLKKVLIVSNRPSISNSWAEDFFKFIGWKGEYAFVSDNDALANRKGVLARKEFEANSSAPKRMIAFESLQGLKGSVHFGGNFNKLEWIKDLEFDLLIVDESHEGVDTMKTERAFSNIKRKHTLYLSGTPFRQLASNQFSAEQIFNWSYSDEQEAKASWAGSAPNPYERLPRLCLFTYQMSEIIRDKAKKGIVITEGDAPVDYAFDLNEFFLTGEKGKFIHEEDVKKFLHALTTQEKYPFSTAELRESLSHTMWYLNRVASAKALKKLLKQDPVFKDYEVVLAAGNERDAASPGLKAFDKVKEAIQKHDKTITLTVGQLTVGVTIPEWSAVMMLCNMSSPAAYMQAAFRAQNPYYEVVDDELLMKENAYVFDFDPARTLVIFDEFANNLSPDTTGQRGTTEERKKKLMRLLNFLPVIGEDSEGKMVELDAAQVLSLPRRLKSQEVVNHGFMSNFLFQNIGNIFSAPEAVRKIMEKLPTARVERRRPRPKVMQKIGQLPVDEEGRVKIPAQVAIGQAQDMFGAKIYEVIDDASLKAQAVLADPASGDLRAKIAEVGRLVKDQLTSKVVSPIVSEKKISKSGTQKIEKKLGAAVDRKLDILLGDYEQAKKTVEAAFQKESASAQSARERRAAIKRRDAEIKKAASELKAKVGETLKETLKKAPATVLREADTIKATEEKESVETQIRAHLRGFTRTIPSFIMAYGDVNLRLSNFEQYVNAEEFLTVTGITMDDFIFLRDGGERQDEKSGETVHFKGNLFDEIVFDDSVQEFLRKKRELADYFDEGRDEDIFDYIPPQRTNQIFTPRKIVRLMVDLLEEQNPGCFDDPNHTFADLYMKSGQYITEIVKRLYRSKGLKKAYPDGKKRIRHILEKQVYGMAPTETIFRIATNYILGFDEGMKKVSHNFKIADTVSAAKKGVLQKLVDRAFSK